MSKLGVAFELLAGLFGWIWIGSIIAAFIFAGLALFGEWNWWNVLYAFLVGGIAKWLARSFFSNRDRVLFEQKLMEEGLSREEAIKRSIDKFDN